MAYVEFDADEVMQEFGDASVVNELAGIVRTDLGGYAHNLGAAYAAGNLAARDVCSLAAAIDNGLRAGQTDVAAQAPLLVAACGRLEREMGAWLENLAQSSARSSAPAVGN